jgi:hypothetical protein
MGKIVRVTTLVLLGALVDEAGTAAGQGCPGDLDGNQNVSIGELVTAVTSALEGCPFPPEPRFVDNGNGTITDNKTGLMWEKKVALDRQTDAANLHDADNTYEARRRCSVVIDRRTYCDSANDCYFEATCESVDHDGEPVTTVLDWLDELNRSRFARHSDWRLPTVAELVELIEYGIDLGLTRRTAMRKEFDNWAACDRDGCTDLTDPACTCTRDGEYLTAELPFDGTYGASRVTVDAGDGYVFGGGSGPARAVRSIR